MSIAVVQTASYACAAVIFKIYRYQCMMKNFHQTISLDTHIAIDDTLSIVGGSVGGFLAILFIILCVCRLCCCCCCDTPDESTQITQITQVQQQAAAQAPTIVVAGPGPG